MRTKHFLLALGLALLACVHPLSQAQESYPTKPIRLINPLSAGGGLDAIARKLATKLEHELSQSVLVDNRPGASGMIAGDMVAKSAPDGYTLLIAPGSTMSILPHVVKKMAYSTADMVPVIQVGTTPFVMLANASNPSKTLGELLAVAKEQPNAVSFGSNGNATLGHLMGEALMRAASVKLLHVAYKGSTPAITDLLGGQVTATMTDFATARPYMQKGGRLRVLALTGARRNASFPSIPTFTEQGFPALEPMTGSILVWAPAATPRAVIDKIAVAILASLRISDMAQTMTEFGYEPTGVAGTAVNAITRQESARWAKIISDIGGITLD